MNAKRDAAAARKFLEQTLRLHGLPQKVSIIATNPKADRAALFLLMSNAACAHYGVQARAQWLGHQAVGGRPCLPKE